MDQKIQERFERIRKEYKKGKRKLEKLQRKNKVKAHVQQKLREQANILDTCTIDNASKSTSPCLDNNSNTIADRSSIPDSKVTDDGLDDMCINCTGNENSPSSRAKHPIDNKAGKSSNNQIPKKCVSSQETHQTLSTGDKMVIHRNLSLTKYKSRNHVVKLSGGSPQTVARSTALTHHNSGIKSGHEQISKRLQDSSCEPQSVGRTKTGCVDPPTHSPDMFDSEALIFERREPSNNKQKTIPCDTIIADSNSTSVAVGKGTEVTVPVDNISPVSNTDGMKEVKECVSSLGTDKSGSSQSTMTESSQLSDNSTADVILKRSLSRRKRRSVGSASRRQSPRVACLNKDKELEVNRNNNSYKVLAKKTQEGIIVSSMFQCLIDDIKRDEKIEHFKLTSDYFIDEPVDNPNNGQESQQKWKQNEEKILKELCEPICKPSPIYLEHETAEMKAESNQVISIITALNDKDIELELSECIKETQSDYVIGKHVLEETNCTKDSISNMHEFTNTISIDVTPPRHEKNSSQTDCLSPTLFESPNTTNDTTPEIINNSATSRFLDRGLTDVLSNSCDTDEKMNDTSGIDNEDIGVSLERTVSLEIPSSEVVLSLILTEKMCTQRTELYIVCLCTQSLRFYHSGHANDKSWKNVLNYDLEPEVHMKKNSGGRLHGLSVKDYVGVLLQQPKTNSTSLHLYLYEDGAAHHVELESVLGKSVCVKCLQQGGFIVSSFTSPSSYLTKYTFKPANKVADVKDAIVTDHIEQLSLERVCGQVTCLVTVEDSNSVVIGLTLSRKLHIWNHCDGIVLCTVDILDVCSKDVFCPVAFSEQGYLFLPLLGRKKGQEVGSVIVVNPLLSSCETLIPLEHPKYNWNGCSWASCMSGDILCARETTGQISLWDIYNGQMLMSLHTLSTTCFTSAYNRMAFVCQNVLHVYTLRNRPAV